MKNNFAEEYNSCEAFKSAYDTAESEEAKETIRAGVRYLMDSIDAKGTIYASAYRLYAEARERGNEYIDLNEVIWDRNVTGLIDGFRELGIERFTFSSTWSGAVETAWLFLQAGCALEGLVEINGPHKAFMSEEYEKVHGYLFRVG